MKGQLYMIPNTMGESAIEYNLPADVIDIIKSLKYYVVENIRSARRFLKKVDKEIDIDELTFFVLDKHTKPNDIPSFLRPLHDGKNMGMLSEAGCPGVADPGADIAKLAHENKINVIPLVGPSSILMSVMASGLNGQSFAFHGYLPVKKGEAPKAIKALEDRSRKENQTQLFIEAPYRNMRMLQDIVQTCSPKTRLCIACDITLDTEYIVTKTIAQWKGKLPDINKRPAIFLILA
ncbi:SAM-dependent methyltransferase [Carboxylicivirga linearis]|uniref:SAM-dependent methyltransferase n=1 Tax=Carboxylicivirga linearis TaxID=1628157 RepID=A0ABS5JS29_9BACT|nr:SAM-dependent methyltransferase [Carboxylicivirga linearis]MBS2097705.1 SAM-dependent methyltransferase [Carboxylicivirga linearis]